MKAVLRQITSTPEQSFLIRKDVGENMLNNWHYHPEIELLFIKKSSGTWLIGDHIGHFQDGDVVLLALNFLTVSGMKTFTPLKTRRLRAKLFA
jgi:hypothetical protein